MKRLAHMLTTLALSGFLVATTNAVQGQVRAEVTADSRLWIEGVSSVSTFTCEAGAIEGQGFVQDVRRTGTLRVPVKQFDCGKRRMNRDFYEAMQADAFPTIEYTLDSTAVAAFNPADETYHLVAYGHLTIAGVQRPIVVPLNGQALQRKQYRVIGSYPLLMTDYGVTPPTALLGLIKTKDRIEVHFDLTARLHDPASESPRGAVTEQKGSLHPTSSPTTNW